MPGSRSCPHIIPNHSWPGEDYKKPRSWRGVLLVNGQGILPIAKSTKPSSSVFLSHRRVTGKIGDVDFQVFPKNFGDWILPGHGEAYVDCGAWRSKGCLNVGEHNQEGLLEHMAGKVFVRRYKRTCLRAECPVCYESWAGKEASKIEHRLSFWEGGQAIHVVVSPPMGEISRLSYEELRRKAYSVSKKSGFKGGSCIFHPFREDESTKTWYFSPHFHMIGYGWISGTKEGFEAHGWVVKNVGIRENISGTALYQLSHAGVHHKYHTITWFGVLAYNKLCTPPREAEKEVCPICGQPLRELWYFGISELPEEEGDHWLEPEGWMYKPRRFSGG